MKPGHCAWGSNGPVPGPTPAGDAGPSGQAPAPQGSIGPLRQLPVAMRLQVQPNQGDENFRRFLPYPFCAPGASKAGRVPRWAKSRAFLAVETRPAPIKTIEGFNTSAAHGESNRGWSTGFSLIPTRLGKEIYVTPRRGYDHAIARPPVIRASATKMIWLGKETVFVAGRDLQA